MAARVPGSEEHGDIPLLLYVEDGYILLREFRAGVTCAVNRHTGAKGPDLIWCCSDEVVIVGATPVDMSRAMDTSFLPQGYLATKVDTIIAHFTIAPDELFVYTRRLDDGIFVRKNIDLERLSVNEACAFHLAISLRAHQEQPPRAAIGDA